MHDKHHKDTFTAKVSAKSALLPALLLPSSLLPACFGPIDAHYSP